MNRIFFVFFVLISFSLVVFSFSGGDGSISNPYQITNWDDLNAIRDSLDSNFVLMNNLDSSTIGFNNYSSGSGWQPIGNNSERFSGSFDGQGYKIYDLYINRSNTNSVGLFGQISQANISNLGIINADVNGRFDVGILVGNISSGSENSLIENVFSTGVVKGRTEVGGLIGFVGFTGTIIRNSFSTADVVATSKNSTTQRSNVGGLIGVFSENKNFSKIENSYATGSVTGQGDNVGGLIGSSQLDAPIINSYSSGKVTGDGDYLGGLIGRIHSSAIISNSFYNSDTSTMSDTGKGVPLNSQEFSNKNNFSNWDFSSIWRWNGINPVLIWEDSEMLLISPNYNNNIFSIQSNTYYVNSNSFDLKVGISAPQSDIDDKCKLFSVLPNSNLRQYASLSIVNDNTCHFYIDGDWSDVSNEGLYTLRLENSSKIPFVEFNLGLDFTKPFFPDSNEDAIIISKSYFKEIFRVDVNTWDNMSGISQVNIQMIDKESKEIRWDAEAVFDPSKNLWFFDFNSLKLDSNGDRILPDGYYDIRAISRDVAGNVNEVTIDPGIDNTAPTINSIIFSEKNLRNEEIIIDINATDNFSGVDVVIAQILFNSNIVPIDSNGNSELIFSKKENNYYSAKFLTNNNWDLGEYNIRIDVNDIAGNLKTQLIDFNLYQNFSFNILDQSKQVNVGQTTSFTLDGNFRADDQNVPILNKILVSSNIVDSNFIEFDLNGFYSINTNQVGVGTYFIDLNYNTDDFNYTKRINLEVIGVSVPQTTGGGGGGTLISLPALIENEVEETQNEVEETQNEVEETQNEVEETQNEVEETQNEVENQQQIFETDDDSNELSDDSIGPTGFFGLGANESNLAIGFGLILLLIIGVIGGAFYFKKRN